MQEFTDLRDKINTLKLEFSMIREVIAELDVRIPQTGRNYPIPKISERALARMEREAALAGQASLPCPTRHSALETTGDTVPGECIDPSKMLLAEVWRMHSHIRPCIPPVHLV